MEWERQIEEVLHSLPAILEKHPEENIQYHISHNLDTPLLIWFETTPQSDVALSLIRLLNVWATYKCDYNKESSVDILGRLRQTFGSDNFQILSARESHNETLKQWVARQLAVLPNELERLKALRKARGARLFALCCGERVALYFAVVCGFALLCRSQQARRESPPVYHSIAHLLSADGMGQSVNSGKRSDQIRKRPGMYVGSVGSKGFRLMLLRLVREMLSQSDNALCLQLMENGGIRITGKSNYRIPVRYVIELQVAHALSRRFCWKDKDIHVQSEKGKIIRQTTGSKASAGYCLEFVPDPDIFDDTTLNYHFLLEHLKIFACLDGSVIEFSDHHNHNILSFPDGLRSYWNNVEEAPWFRSRQPLSLHMEQDDIRVDMVYGFGYEEGIRKSYVNGWATAGKGAHVDGLYLGAQRAFRKYRFLYEDEPVEELSELNYIIHARLEKPRFAGSLKDQITNYEVRKLISKAVSQQLFSSLEKRRKDWERQEK